ncbi:MAG: hypothetical protein ACFFAN_10015, partial [Promethearchaeota archaeon]
FYDDAPDYDITIDEGNLDDYWYTLNNSSPIYPLSTTGTIKPDAWEALPEGDVNITFYASDLAGHVSSDSVIVTKDITSPFITNVSSSNPNGTYYVGQTITITITFSESVYLMSIVRLTLETGSTDAVINCIAGEGTETLLFSYTVQSGHSSPDLDYKSSDALIGTIQDAAGNVANLILPNPGEEYSLGYNKDIIIDGTSSDNGDDDDDGDDDDGGDDDDDGGGKDGQDMSELYLIGIISVVSAIAIISVILIIIIKKRLMR